MEGTAFAAGVTRLEDPARVPTTAGFAEALARDLALAIQHADCLPSKIEVSRTVDYRLGHAILKISTEEWRKLLGVTERRHHVALVIGKDKAELKNATIVYWIVTLRVEFTLDRDMMPKEQAAT